METRLNMEEQEVLRLTAVLWEKYIALEEIHPEDNVEMMRDIHSIQNRVLSRPETRISYGD